MFFQSRAVLVAEATEAQRCSLVERRSAGRPHVTPRDFGMVLGLICPGFSEGYRGEVALAAGGIRLTR